MEQQQANYDLLAAFNDEAAADAAVAKLHKKEYSEDEVFQLAAGSVGRGEFRQHGPDLNRRDLFLEKKPSGPNPAVVVALAVILGLVFGAGTFEAGVLHVAALSLPEPGSALGGGVIGAILGAIIGLFQRGRVRGDIGQATKQTTVSRPSQGARTLVAVRLRDPEDIRRRSSAQAILINSGGKIDKSVGRTR